PRFFKSPAFAGLRTTATSSCPASTNWRATCPPTKPVVPVTKYFITLPPISLPDAPHRTTMPKAPEKIRSQTTPQTTVNWGLATPSEPPPTGPTDATVQSPARDSAITLAPLRLPSETADNPQAMRPSAQNAPAVYT